MVIGVFKVELLKLVATPVVAPTATSPGLAELQIIPETVVTSLVLPLENKAVAFKSSDEFWTKLGFGVVIDKLITAAAIGVIVVVADKTVTEGGE